MKKLLPHIIYILIITFLVFYANIKANEAEKMTTIAVENEYQAAKNAEDARQQAVLAEQMAAEARASMREAREAVEKLSEALKKCK